eukprot:Anaeramoba_ignava/a478887_16.p1 GENE.a478887_16~~a478887_16.p1  ORF type:complete len:124 (-),score=41.71 a478887_16:57-428(-)
MFAFGKPKQHFFPSIQKTKCISTNQNQTFSIILTKTTVNILDAFNTQKLYHFTYNDQHGFFKKMCWATNSLFIISTSKNYLISYRIQQEKTPQIPKAINSKNSSQINIQKISEIEIPNTKIKR